MNNELVEFWEQLGFIKKQLDAPFKHLFHWEHWNGKECDYYEHTLPELTLDNLFKYAVPKLDAFVQIGQLDDGSWSAKIIQFPSIDGFGDNPAQALYQAIKKVMKDE